MTLRVRSRWFPSFISYTHKGVVGGEKSPARELLLLLLEVVLLRSLCACCGDARSGAEWRETKLRAWWIGEVTSLVPTVWLSVLEQPVWFSELQLIAIS